MTGYHHRFLNAAVSGARHDGLCRHAIELGCFELVDSLPIAADGGIVTSESRPVSDLAQQWSHTADGTSPRVM